MPRTLKPLSARERKVINQLAAVLVCAGIESGVVAPQYEKQTGKKYDPASARSYLNTFLNKNPEYKRVWKLLLKDKASHERDFAEQVRRECGK
ncbi:TPA: hypothetical protein MX306_003073 [Citrobacter freundii]|nr:hypothetical protein [Citrobacter freundii]HCA7356747.1 hypothetical protein [Citrobacter freundii]HEI8930990.1 hypothetical protein [Citrobacter freundii]